MGFDGIYPLVTIQKTMENHNFYWENSLEAEPLRAFAYQHLEDHPLLVWACFLSIECYGNMAMI